MDVNGRHWGVATIGAIVDDFDLINLSQGNQLAILNQHLLL